MVASGFTITRAIQSKSWPAASANLEFAAVWGTYAQVDDAVPRHADDMPVARISTLLEAQGRTTGNPTRLTENTGIAFIGCYALGMGFVLEPDEAQEWIAADARNADVLFPYLNGEDLNSRADASASRWVIDFNDRSEEEAAEYPLPYARLRDEVKPERARKPKAVSTAPWWQFLRTRPAMRQAIAELSEVLVLAQVSNTAQPMLIPKGIVPSHKIVVFASESRVLLAVLSSSLHYLWARKYSGAMKNDLSYSPSDVFLTFPMPEPTDRLERAGLALEAERREIMLRRNLGLTKLYNLVNDPAVGEDDVDIARIREIQVEVDRATTEAYGWDIPLRHGFHSYRQIRRWSPNPAARVELLDRLLEENHRRQGADGETAIRQPAGVTEVVEDTLLS